MLKNSKGTKNYDGQFLRVENDLKSVKFMLELIFDYCESQCFSTDEIDLLAVRAMNYCELAINCLSDANSLVNKLEEHYLPVLAE